MPSTTNRLVDVEVHLHHDTGKARKVSLDGDEKNAVWVPNSIGEVSDEVRGSDVRTLTLPEAWAIDKDLI